MTAVPLAQEQDVQPDLRAVFVDISEKCTLPPLPQVASRALAMVQDPTTEFPQIAGVIEKEPALAARVLRMASSAFYVRRFPPDTLCDAVRTLGMAGLRDIVVAASVCPSFDPDDGFHQRLWDHSLAAAAAADAIARASGAPRGGLAFICGLLHDTGRLVHHLTNRAAFAELGMADRDEPSMEEREAFGASHDVVASCLAWKWGLSPSISEALIAHHEEPHHVPPLTAHVIVGDRVARALEGEAGQVQIVGEMLGAIGIDAEAAKVVDEIGASLEENRSFFT